MGSPETAGLRPGFDYEALESVLSQFRGPEADKTETVRQAIDFFEPYQNTEVKLSGYADMYIAEDGAKVDYEKTQWIAYRQVIVRRVLEEGLAVGLFEWGTAMPILKWETIDPVPPGGLDEVPFEE